MCVLCGLGSHCMLFMEMENARRRPVASLSRPSWQLVSSADTLTLQRAPLPVRADLSPGLHIPLPALFSTNSSAFLSALPVYPDV